MKRDNKGFTLIEVLAVVSLLAILITVATVSILRYRKDVNEKELTTLRSTIKSSFENYRFRHSVSSGKDNKVSLNLSNLGLINRISYNNVKFKDDDLNKSFIYYVVKDWEKVKKTTVIEVGDGSQCDRDENNNPILSEDKRYCFHTEILDDASQEEVYCIYLEHDGVAIINDVENNADCKR